MNIKNKRFLRILTSILILTLLSVLFACQPQKEPEQSNNTTAEVMSGDTMESDNAIDEHIYPNLPDQDFGGYTFTFLTRTINDPNWADANHRDLFAEEQNGEAINDAVYTRNRIIEAKYNFTIQEIVTTNFVGDVSKTVSAGDATYDAVFPHVAGELATLSTAGCLRNLFSIPYMDLTQPWWSQGFIRDLSIGGKLYAIQSDLTILDNDSISAMIFNKKLTKDLELTDPYELVKSGKWTLDNMYSMIKAASKDLNGDSKMDTLDDRFGMIAQADSGLSFLYGAGERVAGKDEKDYPALAFNKDRVYSVLEKVSEIMLDTDNVVDWHREGEGRFNTTEQSLHMIQSDLCLFSWIRMRVVEKLRGMETDFGILPIPKYDEVQERHWSQVNSNMGDALAIPVTGSDEDTERTGIILEALTAESKYTLQPAYYDINLYGKYVRDEESGDMLDIILNTTMYDLGEVYGFGGFAGNTLLWYPTQQKTDYASAYDKAESKMQKDIDKIIDQYMDIDS